VLIQASVITSPVATALSFAFHRRSWPPAVLWAAVFVASTTLSSMLGGLRIDRQPVVHARDTRHLRGLPGALPL
jgi:hypothetical protein